MIVVGTTIAPYKCDGVNELAWLRNADEMDQHEEDVRFFVAMEMDSRRDEPYERLFDALDGLPNDVWGFMLDDAIREITSSERLVRICTGRNFVIEYAMRIGASHILFVDSDLYIPGNAIIKMLEIDHPVVGGNVPLYCLDGPKVEQYPDLDVREHWNTAGFLFVRREVFSKIRWRWEIDSGMTDDPCFQHDQQVWGFGQTWVRHDVEAESPDKYIVPVEHRNIDRTIY